MPARRRRRIIFAQAAERDLHSIYEHIASQDAITAERQLLTISEACESLADFPERGMARPDLASGLRQIVIDPYIAFYLIGRQTVEIARVLHGRRNILEAFRDRSG